MDLLRVLCWHKYIIVQEWSKYKLRYYFYLFVPLFKYITSFTTTIYTFMRIPPPPPPHSPIPSRDLSSFLRYSTHSYSYKSQPVHDYTWMKPTREGFHAHWAFYIQLNYYAIILHNNTINLYESVVYHNKCTL